MDHLAPNRPGVYVLLCAIIIILVISGCSSTEDNSKFITYDDLTYTGEHFSDPNKFIGQLSLSMYHMEISDGNIYAILMSFQNDSVAFLIGPANIPITMIDGVEKAKIIDVSRAISSVITKSVSGTNPNFYTKSPMHYGDFSNGRYSTIIINADKSYTLLNGDKYGPGDFCTTSEGILTPCEPIVVEADGYDGPIVVTPYGWLERNSDSESNPGNDEDQSHNEPPPTPDDEAAMILQSVNLSDVFTFTIRMDARQQAVVPGNLLNGAKTASLP